MKARVILVDENDKEIGFEEKMEAHKTGKLHRAFSIFVFNSKGELLLQRRAKDKYHSGGLWSNTCCSHPRVGETLEEAVHRRLKEEMGFDCELREAFHFIYKAKVGDLTEHELDHVFIGRYNGEVNPNPDEVEEYKWVPVASLNKDMKVHTENYTEWFKIAFERTAKRENLL
ncbi:MAG: isopentenyl-diphosphate Delta-isomerase [Theionarchaea archaeon]|nr:MAG: isopentenyl-diphosphate delta-isomerase [Theionarchaea archaeon DG-70]MBU7011008.1 isopentenyl-diphosphate Delta-isomerase [Theionarchaea archaeon]